MSQIVTQSDSVSYISQKSYDAITVTCHISQENMVEGSGKNDVIQCIKHMVI